MTEGKTPLESPDVPKATFEQLEAAGILPAWSKPQPAEDFWRLDLGGLIRFEIERCDLTLFETYRATVQVETYRATVQYFYGSTIEHFTSLEAAKTFCFAQAHELAAEMLKAIHAKAPA